MPWLDFDGLGGLQPKLCLEKLRLHSRMWNGLAWPGLWAFKPNQTKPHFHSWLAACGSCGSARAPPGVCAEG